VNPCTGGVSGIGFEGCWKQATPERKLSVERGGGGGGLGMLERPHREPGQTSNHSCQ
jgi:hypothetical protein